MVCSALLPKFLAKTPSPSSRELSLFAASLVSAERFNPSSVVPPTHGFRLQVPGNPFQARDWRQWHTYGLAAQNAAQKDDLIFLLVCFGRRVHEHGMQLCSPIRQVKGKGAVQAYVREDRVGGASRRRGIVVRGDGNDAASDQRQAARSGCKPGARRRDCRRFLQNGARKIAPTCLARGGHVINPAHIR